MLRLRRGEVDQFEHAYAFSETFSRELHEATLDREDTRDAARKSAIPGPGFQVHPVCRSVDVVTARSKWDRLLTWLDDGRLFGAGKKRCDDFDRCRRGTSALEEVAEPRANSLALQSDFVLKQRLEAVEERIDTACTRSGRKRSDITLVAVTKIFPASVVKEAYEIGLRDFGENYVQEFAGKAPELGPMPGARFHLIGHLQSNKAKLASELFQVIETVDSREARKAPGCDRSIARRDDRSEAFSLKSRRQARIPRAVPALIDAIRRMSEPAAHRPDDDAALVRRCGAFTTILPDAARTWGSRRIAATVDGHVA